MSRPVPVRLFSALLWLFWLLSAMLGATAVSAQSVGASSGQVVLQLDFQDATNQNWMEGFSRGDPKYVMIGTEGAQKFLRFRTDRPHSAIIHRNLPIDPSWGLLNVSVRARASGLVVGDEVWKTGQVQISFFDAENRRVGGWPPKLLVSENTPWVTLSQTYTIPDRATTLRVEVGMWASQGTVDFDDLRIEARGAGQLPPGESLFWGREPVEVISAKRGRVVLNGLWTFVPARNDATDAPAGIPGYIRVPGSWSATGLAPGIVVRGKGLAWDGFVPNETGAAWYERDLTIPQEWAGRHIGLHFARLSTDAVVFVDGQRVGEVAFPGGDVNLTGKVTPGRTHRLRVLVLATDDEDVVLTFMETANSQVLRKPARLENRGIIGDVLLLSRPDGPHVADVFAQTSVREKQLKLEVTLEQLASAGDVSVTALLRDEQGNVEREFSATARVESAPTATVRVGWTWDNPRLWDVGQPNLYQLELHVRGAGVDDVITQRLGFRELWVEGRRFFLNGKEIRFRPALAPTTFTPADGVAEVAEQNLRDLMARGVNLVQIWPNDEGRRGFRQYWHIWYDAADRLGLPIAGVALSMNRSIVDTSWRFIWDAQKDTYRQRLERQLRGVRNHPSVVMWGTSANFFGAADDQDPRKIGRRVFENTRFRAAGKEGIEIIRSIDPTRPIFTHQGADVGDIHSVNTYLNLLPLQEREEWLSHWAEHGEMPYLAVEFGTPQFNTFLRGRNGFGNSVHTEPLVSEFLAIYLGREAYRLETQAYREQIAVRFRENQQYSSWHANNEVFVTTPAYQALQALFQRNSFRSWRTWGISGGMIPWDNGYAAFRGPAADEEVAVAFNPGRLGTYIPRIPRRLLQRFQPPGWQVSVAGEAQFANNGPVLAYIGGSPEWVDKDHLFAPGQTVTKQIVILNDTRSPQPYQLRWTASLGGRPLASGEVSGTLDVAATVFRPIEVVLPGSSAPALGQIDLSGTIGPHNVSDRFDFRVHPGDAHARGVSAFVFDPAGHTTRLLSALGVSVAPWDRTARDGLVLIGREALTPDNAVDIMQALQKHVAGGGRAVVFQQQPAVLQRLFGFRTAPYVSRRVFTMGDHPVTRGLTDDDLRDWSGVSTLLPAYPDMSAPDVPRGANDVPRYGWRWGNRGMVTSAPVEKPHHAGWRPILECEWDLAYSPLLELDHGRGRVLLCQLDLEDHFESTPPARTLAAQLLRYAATAPLAPRAQRTVLVGSDAEAALLTSLTLRFERRDQLDPAADLLIVGGDVSPDEAALRRFLSGGGKVLFLASTQSARPLGVQLAAVDRHDGSIQPPPADRWPEAAGLGPSDLRRRTAGPAHVVRSGGMVAADGLLARQTLGRGVAVYLQLDPARLDADTRTYNRYTRWRHTRAIAQVLANLGATFDNDARFFNPIDLDRFQVPLAGTWQAKWVNRLDDPTGTAEHEDPGMSPAALALLQPEADLTGFTPMPIPGGWDDLGPHWAQANGEAVIRRTFEMPEHLLGRDLILHLGQVDDRDVTVINGVEVGRSPDGVPSQWNVRRTYRVPASALRPGTNVIAVRVWDRFRGGGITGVSTELRLAVPDDQLPKGLYHPDYRTDFELGDDPYRYYRW